MKAKLIKLWAWLMALVVAKKVVEQIESHVEPVKPQRKPRRKPVDEIKSLGELLAAMDETFTNYTIPFSKHSWITRSEATGLRKMGAHIPHPYRGDLLTGPLPTKGLPGMFFVAPGWSRFDTAKGMYPAVLFGIKVAKLPAEVEQMNGVHYKFGIGLKMGVDSVGDVKKELFWAAGYITVLKDGTTHIHDERTTQLKQIKVKSPAQRRAVGGATITVPSRRWMPASIVRVGLDKDHSLSQLHEATKAEFVSAVLWWMGREDRWNVIVKKSGERVTFGVPKELTKTVFRDRIKAQTPNGGTKPIFHYVKAHTRVTGAEVKAHVRGLDHFSWKAYQCQITAPRLTSTTAATFELVSEEHVGTEDIDLKNFIDISKLGAILAEQEEIRREVV
jgi:hypothetical protein